MALATETAYAALEAAFTGAPNLPPIVRNDQRLTGFTPSGVDGIGHKLVIFDEAPTIIATELGDTTNWELGCVATFVFMVEGEAGPDRDGVWLAGLEAMRDVLFPGGRGLVIPGVIEDLRWESAERDHYLEAPERKPVEKLEFSVSLTVTAATPFG